MTQTYTSTSVPTYTTRVSNDVVFLRRGNTSTFDTLYHFNAVPGNQWQLPESMQTSSVTCNRHVVTVLDTGHRMISNVNLRWLKVSIFNNTGLVNDTLIERIGLKNYFYFTHHVCPIPPAADPPIVAGLRCYNDAQINYKFVNTTCNYIYLNPSSLDENSMFNSVTIYPNPSENKIFIDYNLQEMSPFKLVITNYLGQVVYEVENVLPNQEIKLQTLKKGLYFLAIQDGKRQKVFKVLKE